jgi:hypothetical protein
VQAAQVNASGTVEGHELGLLPEMVARYAPMQVSEDDSAYAGVPQMRAQLAARKSRPTCEGD